MMAAYPCGKFSDGSFSRFGLIVRIRADTQNLTQNHRRG